MEESQQQIDHYDYINAPQFVDFDDLAAQDDPDADKFFETHREEDDFMIPVDINAISPTVQLLYNNETDNEHYSNQANEAAHAAGLQDVKIEYYASPNGGRSTTPPMELENPRLQDILKKLSIIDLDDEDEDAAGKEQELRSSIVVVPSVGKQVYWHGGTPNNLEQRPLTSLNRSSSSSDDWHEEAANNLEQRPLTSLHRPSSSSDDWHDGAPMEQQPLTSLRRPSSCSDLRALHYEHKTRIPSTLPPKLKPVQKKPLTVPKTPDAMKRAPKVRPLASSTGQNIAAKKLGSNFGNRLADTGSRQPVKANHYVSMAEAMIKYQKNTPDRFRSLPKGRLAPQKRSTSCDARKRTQPSPIPSPDSRFHGNSFKENKAPVKHPKANMSGPILPKKVELKPTVPQPFNFGSTHRSKPVPVKEVMDFKFKARPVPSNVLMDKTVIAKPKAQTKVTLPVAPHFASDDRIRERHQKMAQIETASVTKSSELKTSKNVPQAHRSRIPTAGHSSNKSQVDDHKTTVAQPFSSDFEARQQAILRRKEDKVKELEEGLKTGREFHANPVPKFPGKLPKKKPTEVTHAEPFRLKADERGEAYQQAFKKKVEEELQQMKEQAEFHAKSADVVHRAPFEPERPTRIIEGPMDFHLATEKRAAEREYFDEQIREKEREEEERRRQEQEMLEEAQRQEDIERRRQMVHKAQPFKDPKPFQLKSSSIPLTVPESPAFSAMPSERRVKH